MSTFFAAEKMTANSRTERAHLSSLPNPNLIVWEVKKVWTGRGNTHSPKTEDAAMAAITRTKKSGGDFSAASHSFVLRS